jgi:hydroxyacylglutathione hydrolase
VIKVGKRVELEVHGHARPHDVPHLPALAHRPPALFSGDTLFNAGRQASQRRQRRRPVPDVRRTTRAPPENTRVYPGHDYIANNLRFTLSREPANEAAAALLPQVAGKEPAPQVTTLADEKKINTFSGWTARA